MKESIQAFFSYAGQKAWFLRDSFFQALVALERWMRYVPCGAYQAAEKSISTTWSLPSIAHCRPDLQ
ncbi:MAG: hypothetical protein ACT4NU_04325 [Chromatiales bacterium]